MNPPARTTPTKPLTAMAYSKARGWRSTDCRDVVLGAEAASTRSPDIQGRGLLRRERVSRETSIRRSPVAPCDHCTGLRQVISTTAPVIDITSADGVGLCREQAPVSHTRHGGHRSMWPKNVCSYRQDVSRGTLSVQRLPRKTFPPPLPLTSSPATINP